MNDDLLNGVEDQQVVEDQYYDPMADFDSYMSESGNSHDVEESTNADNGDDLLDDNANNISYNADLVNEVLKAKGFDPEAIRIEDEETGEETTVKFSELSVDEQREILGYEDDNAPYYSDDEVEAINYLRQNNMTLNDLVEYVKSETIREMQNQPTDQVYSVDDFSDDELYIADFTNKYGEDFTEQELLDMLESAKANEQVFNRQVAKLREDYKQMEIEQNNYKQQQEAEAEKQKQEQYFNSVRDFANQVNEMHGTVELDNKDKNGILDYMFKKNVAGKSGFDKDLEDPRNRYMAAWYFKHGDEAIQGLHRYYRGEIAKLQRQLKTRR
jgi:hypothetical protein